VTVGGVGVSARAFGSPAGRSPSRQYLPDADLLDSPVVFADRRSSARSDEEPLPRPGSAPQTRQVVNVSPCSTVVVQLWRPTRHESFFIGTSARLQWPGSRLSSIYSRGPSEAADGSRVRRPEDSLAAVSTLERLLLVDMQLSPAMLVEDATPERVPEPHLDVRTPRRRLEPWVSFAVDWHPRILAVPSLVHGTVNRVLPPVLPPRCPNGSKRLEHTSDTTPICVDYNVALERPGLSGRRRRRRRHQGAEALDLARREFDRPASLFPTARLLHSWEVGAMAGHPLDGCRAKLARAEDHLDRLDAEVAEHFGPNPA
jgi:hypothetical protein